MFNIFKKKFSEPQNLEEILKEFRKLQNNFNNLSKELEELKKESHFFVKKVSIIRFNPFNDMGGNQSFALALLNNQNNGVVISGIYTREGNRIYAKPIKAGSSEYPLSKEEKEAIAKAENSNFSLLQLENFYDGKSRKNQKTS